MLPDQGWLTWASRDAGKFKCYYYNGMAFRLRFPNNYDSSGAKACGDADLHTETGGSVRATSQHTGGSGGRCDAC